MAASTVEGTGHPDFPPFTRLEVTAIELTQAHAHTLDINGMSMLRSAIPTPVF
jgi:hypothetical protein